MSGDNSILITGATGFLGSWTINRLLDQGLRVIASDISGDHHRLSLLRPDMANDAVDFRICNVSDGAALDALVAETQPSAIVHLAAIQIPQCAKDPALGAAVNVSGQINVFEAARRHKVRHVVYSSSIAAKSRGPANAPANLYGVFKKAGEEIARIYWQDHGLPSFGLRPFIVYGVGRDDGETSVITRAIEAAALGRSYEIPFSTESCFQYVGDVADSFAALATASWDGALMSDVTDTVQSTADVLDAIRTVVPDADISAAGAERIAPPGGFDTAALQTVVGDRQEVSLTEGIRRTVELYRRIALREPA